MVLIEVEVKVYNGYDNSIGGSGNNSDSGISADSSDGDGDNGGKGCLCMKINNCNSDYHNL